MEIAVFMIATLAVAFTSQSTANKIHEAIRRKQHQWSLNVNFSLNETFLVQIHSKIVFIFIELRWQPLSCIQAVAILTEILVEKVKNQNLNELYPASGQHELLEA